MTEIAKPLGVSVEETMRLTSLGKTTVWKLIGEGRLKVVRIGSRTVVLYESIENLFPHSPPHSVANFGDTERTETYIHASKLHKRSDKPNTRDPR